jgi:hypothetical protein
MMIGGEWEGKKKRYSNMLLEKRYKNIFLKIVSWCVVSVGARK